MRRQRWWLPLVAFVFIANLKSTLTLPVPDEEVDTSPKLLGSSVVTSVSIVTGSSDNVDDENSMKADSADRMRVMPSEQMLGSPADLLRPDRFQFYTLNKDGHVVTRQMTEQEIQSLIAAGGGHLPMEIHEPQKAGDVPTGGMKVSDVVQNVQNVLKGELNKPTPVMTSVPTIPGHVNTEWSSILPAILGGETDTVPVNESDPPMQVDISEAPIIVDTTLVKMPESAVSQTTTTKLPTKEQTSSSSAYQESTEKPAGILETETHDEKPMIQVPVITVDQKLPSHEEEVESMPVFQMLNTISADKVNAKNSTNNKDKPKPVVLQHTDLEQSEIVVKTEKPAVKPDSVTESIIEVSTTAKDGLSEMIEINLNSNNDKPSVVADTKKPVLKPDSGIITAEMLKTPESESPTILTVVSETHSTSMKVSGHEEIPLREPPKPVTESADQTRVPSETKNPEKVTEKSTIISTTEAMLDVTSLKAEAPVAPAQAAESSTEPGLFAQGVSFFGNLPQTVSSIVSDFISNNTPNSTPVVADAKLPVNNSENANESVGATDSVKIIEATKSPAGQTTVASTRETVTSTEPTVKQEPVFQMMPEIIPDKKVPSHGAMPSEASSIEHIIETLSDPTGSLSGTVAADHYVVLKKPENKLNVTKVDNMQTETAKPLSVSQDQTSTVATPVSVKTPLESSSTKPMAPLPTELADSLSSMISQISDTMPSVLPVGENAGLDTNEKKNGNADAEEPSTTEILETTTIRKVSKTTEAPVNKVHVPVEEETEKPATIVLSTKAPERQNPTVATNIAVEESTEKLRVSPTTEVSASEPVTTEASRSDISTTMNSDILLANQEVPEVPVNKIDESVADALTASDPKLEKSKPEANKVPASFDITTDKELAEAVAQESVKTEAVTESAATNSTLKQSSTGKPATTITSSTVPPIVGEQTKIPIEVQTDSPAITQEPPKPQSLHTETPTKVESVENKTEQSIVRIDITEAKPTQFIHANKPQESTNIHDGAESPLVRIKLTDPVGIINHMIASANVDVTPSPVAPLVLPVMGNVLPNTIASGLIAGFPSSTTQATKTSDPDTEENLTTNAPVKIPPEVQIINDAPVSEVAEDVKTSEIQVESSTKAETPGTVGPNKEFNVTESNEDSKMSSPKNVTAAPDIPIKGVDLPSVPVIVESPEKSSTQITLNPQISMDNSKIEEPIAETTSNKSAGIEVSTTLPTTQAPMENVETTTKLIKNEAIGVEQTTMEVIVSPVDDAPANRIETSTLSVVQQTEPDDKLLNEASKIIETAVSTTMKAEVTTVEPESTESKTQNSAIQPESTNITKLEDPDVRINVAPEKFLDHIPSKIQLTDLPIVQTTLPTKKPLNNDGIQTLHPTQNPQLVTTMQSIVDSSNNNEENSNAPLQGTVASTVEKTTTEAVEEIPKLEEVVTKPEKTETSGEAILPENISESSNPITVPQQTEEVRIQVNDTAVLVTKRPVADSSVQKLEDVQKTPENEVIDEQPTTSKIATPVTEEPSGKLGDKIVLPVPVKISELASHEETPENPSITKVVSGAMGTETRIRLGEEQVQETKGDKLSEKIDDSRKPIKKNSDGNVLPNGGQPILPESTTRTPSVITNVSSTNLEKDSNVQSTTEGRIIMSVSFNQVSNFSKVNEPVKVQEKPSKLPDKKTPIKIVTERPIPKPVKLAHKPTMNIKKDDGAPRPAEEQWTLIPQQVYPGLMKPGTHAKRPVTTEEPATNPAHNDQKMNTAPPRTPVSLDHPQSANGLDSTVRDLETDISYFANLCNELAFSFWTATNKGLSTARSLAVSPFGMTSMLAMVFLGARGPTSDQMNDILKLDDVASFNPHLVFQNVTDAVGLARNQGIANAAFVRELFADRSKVRKLMPFYKEQAQQFYDGIVAEVNFATISDLVRRRTNLMIRKQTGGRIKDFVRTNTVPLRSPLAALSANVFQTDCNSSAASSEGRDGELYFAVSPAVRQRKLVPVPATVWRAGVLAGYEPSLDATAIALGGTDKLVSTIFVIPGQQGHTAPGDTLDRLEQRIVKGATHDGSWNKLLKVLIPRPGLELQVPKFSHRSVINATAALKRMGLEELFSKHADLKGINGIATDLHLADVLQMNLFSTCGDENIISGRHHVEVYPGSPLRNAREYEFEEQTDDEFTDYLTDKQQHPALTGSAIPYVLNREARSARQHDGTEKQRLKLDRPFLYFVRHNPTGLILHMGRFNPRLLP